MNKALAEGSTIWSSLVEDELGCRIKEDFPVLANGELAYLDSSASAQKPRQVIEAMSRFYSSQYANIHRGVYELSAQATDMYESARASVARFIGANSSEIVFTRSATESINLVANAWARGALCAGDEIVVTVAEHHSNFVPWQELARQLGVKLVVVPLSEGALSGNEQVGNELFPIESFETCISNRTRLVAITHLSNVLGAYLPIKEIVKLAHARGAVVLVDAAQSIPHGVIDVNDMDCDFLVFSGHKLYGPTGIGVLYGKSSMLDKMSPYQFGGDMIEEVTLDGTTYNSAPYKFEAGTPHIAGAIGLAAAIDYLSSLPIARVWKHEAQLVTMLEQGLLSLDGVSLIGGVGTHHGLVSFVVESVQSYDLAEYVGLKGVAVRTGHHCAQPLLHALGYSSTVRASFGIYTTISDVNRCIEAIREAIHFFRRGRS